MVVGKKETRTKRPRLYSNKQVTSSPVFVPRVKPIVRPEKQYLPKKRVHDHIWMEIAGLFYSLGKVSVL